MKMFRLTAMMLVTVAGSLCRIAQADAFDDLKTYDFQNRTAVVTILKMIDDSRTDKAMLAQIETKLDAVILDPKTNGAGLQEACKFLGQIGSKASVPALAKLLTDEKTENNARYALERITDPDAVTALRTAFNASSGRTKIGIINSLGDRADAESVSLLKPLTTSPDGELRGAAISALGKIGTVPALSALGLIDDKSLLVSQAMLKAANKLAAQKSNRGEAEKTYLALTAAGNLPVVRAAALHGLAAMGSSHAGGVSLAGMKDSDPLMRIASARVYSGLPEAKKAHFFSDLSAIDAPTQIVLITGFADNGVTNAIPLATQAMSSSDPELRRAAIQAMARLGGAAAVPKLADIAAHGEGDDKRTARESLIGMTGKEADAAILQAEKTGEPVIQTTLLGIMAERPTAGTRAVFLSTAEGADAKTASEALRSLEKSGTATEYPQIVKILATATNDSVIDAAHNAVVAIANRSGDRDKGAAPLLVMEKLAPTSNRVSILGALAEIGGAKSLETLTQATASSQPEIKTGAMTALAETWADSSAMPILLTIAKSETGKAARIQALRGYLRLAGQDEKIPVPDKIAAVQSALAVAERPEEKRQALGILRDCRTESSVTLAAKYLDDPELFADAADTVLALAAPQRRNRVRQPAVTGAATIAALDKIIALAKDDTLREQARKLK